MVADRYVALCLLLTGLSHVVQPTMWTEFFRKLVQAKIVAVCVAFYTMPVGLILLLSRSDWRWGSQWVFIGLGLSFTLKATIYLLAPKLALRTVEQKGLDPRNMRIAGVVMVAFSPLILWVAFG